VVNEEGNVSEIITAEGEQVEDIAEAIDAIVEEMKAMKTEMAAMKLQFAKFSKEPKEKPELKFPKGSTRQELLIKSLKKD
jgi:hypothetical protein